MMRVRDKKKTEFDVGIGFVSDLRQGNLQEIQRICLKPGKTRVDVFVLRRRKELPVLEAVLKF